MIARCIGYAEDDLDCYIIMQCPTRGVFKHTMVGGYYYLSGLKAQSMVISTGGEEWNDLTRLSNDLTRAGVPLAEKFIVEPSHD